MEHVSIGFKNQHMYPDNSPQISQYLFKLSYNQNYLLAKLPQNMGKVPEDIPMLSYVSETITH